VQRLDLLGGQRTVVQVQGREAGAVGTELGVAGEVQQVGVAGSFGAKRVHRGLASSRSVAAANPAGNRARLLAGMRADARFAEHEGPLRARRWPSGRRLWPALAALGAQANSCCSASAL
jgi:hypothetical protein